MEKVGRMSVKNRMFVEVRNDVTTGHPVFLFALMNNRYKKLNKYYTSKVKISMY